MTECFVEGPFEVPVHVGKKGRVVRQAEGATFFTHHPSLESKKGCYVFAMRAGRGITPAYVGVARKGFGQECFTSHKLGKCNAVLVEYARGTLVMFLVVAPDGRGRPPSEKLRLVEDFLIQAGVAANPSLLNVKGTKRADWAIAGVIRGRRGRRSKAATAFRSMMKLNN